VPGAAGERRARQCAGVDHGAEDDDGIGGPGLVLETVGIEQGEGEGQNEDGGEEEAEKKVWACGGAGERGGGHVESMSQFWGAGV